MLERILKFSAVLLIGCLLLPGCSHFTKSGRQQIAYQRYVKKCGHMRTHQRTKITKQQQRVPDSKSSKYEVNSGVVSSPQSVSSAESQGEQ
jgi:hypothetical protein